MFTLKSSPFARAFAAAALIGTVALAAPSFATSASSPNSSSPVKATQVAATAKKGHRTPEDMAAAIEDRIKTLHEKLSITSEQESSWNDFAQAMRDNENSMSQAIQQRRAEASTMSAPEDLSAYQKIAQAHADGLSKVASAFQPVYDSMSDEQKKNADQVFGQFEGHRGLAKASAHKSAKKSAPATESSSGSDSAE